MKKALVIAAREFEEKRFVAYAAVAFAILPFILAAIPGIGTKSPADVIGMSALVFATIFALALGVISGASFIGRDLSDGRMSFYFSRPVSSLSIWFGKLTAGVLMIVGTFGFIVVPARLAAGVHWTRMVSASTTWSVLYLLAIAIALFLLAHVIGTFARSRSPLIVFDFAAAVICGVVIRLLFLPLIAGQAFVLLRGLAIALGIAAVIAIVAGGAWQLERGRTDRRRSHLALSQFLWGTIAVALVIAAAYVGWVVSVKPSDLTAHLSATQSTNGPFAVVTGTSKGRSDYRGAFLLDAEDGARWRVDQWAEWAARYTRDGRSAVIPRRSGSGAEVFIYTRGRAEPVATGLTMTAGNYFVSDDGGRIATITQPSNLSVYDVATKRSLVTVRLPESRFSSEFFSTPDVVRIYLNTFQGLKIVELDVRSRALRETGFIASPSYVLSSDSSGAHILVRRSREDVLTLTDARTGAAIKTLTSGTHLRGAEFLRDGRIAIVDGADSATVLHILTSGGTPQHDIPLGAKRRTRILGDDGTRLVLSDTDVTSKSILLEAVNINSGVIEHRQPIREWVYSSEFDVRPPVEPLRDVFYFDANGHVAAWNPATGGTRTITGG